MLSLSMQQIDLHSIGLLPCSQDFALFKAIEYFLLTFLLCHLLKSLLVLWIADQVIIKSIIKLRRIISSYKRNIQCWLKSCHYGLTFSDVVNVITVSWPVVAKARTLEVNQYQYLDSQEMDLWGFSYSESTTQNYSDGSKQ